MPTLPPASDLRSDERELALAARQRSRERSKLIGLIAIALFILALAYLRFGKTIPWGAR
ncbi:MAG: hypothetical protein P4M04_10970 [Acidobacteriota bacterium]|nr:hypothetical protein [Acidobacteriota bacterium]